MRSADVLVATPGRLIDLLDNGGVRPRLAQIRGSAPHLFEICISADKQEHSFSTRQTGFSKLDSGGS